MAFNNWDSSLRNGEHFPDPFMDMGSMAIPTQHRNVLQWAEYAFHSNGTYRQAMERLISYFLTDIDVGSPLSAPGGQPVSDDEQQKFKNFLTGPFDVLNVLQCLLRDRVAYGNAFASIISSFERMLVCPKCFVQIPLRVAYNNPSYAFKFQNWEFHGRCPKCEYAGKQMVHDLSVVSEDKLRLKRWSPHEIEIIHDPMTDDTAYIWRIPEDYKRQLSQGSLFLLERVSMEVLKAIRNNWVFTFKPDAIYHMKEPTLAGFRNRGWGISRTIVNFRQIFYVQILKRYNESIALDYVIPFRLLTPALAGKGGGGDPLFSYDMGDFGSQVDSMLSDRRRDPARWNWLPFPVQYQSLGGEASQMATHELLNQGQQTLLNDVGVPIEMFQGSLQAQGQVAAIRMFEATHYPLVHDMNRFLDWLVRQLSRLLSWEAVSCQLRKPIYADDINRTMVALQAAVSQQVSQTSALKNLGFEWKDEQRRIAEEARFMAEQQARMSQESEQAAVAQQLSQGQPGGPGQPAPAGGAAPGGAGAPVPGNSILPMIPPPDSPITPDEMEQLSMSIAQTLLGLPESQKDSELRTLKQQNSTLHAQVRASLDSIRNQARMAGGAQLMSQQFGTAPPAQ